MSHLFDVADAVVAELNAISLSQSFTATRVLLADVKWDSLDTLRVAVSGVSITPKRITREKISRKIVVEICVMKRLSAVTAGTVDPFVSFMEEIAEHFESERLANRPGALVESAIVKPPYSEEHLSKFKQFTGLVTLAITDWT